MDPNTDVPFNASASPFLSPTQMLNCCIEHKKARDNVRKDAAGENGPQVSPGKSWDSWSDSEEEFFECLSDTEDIKEVAADGGKGAGGKAKPEGRLQPHGKLTLLNSNEPLYIPVTQVSQEVCSQHFP